MIVGHSFQGVSLAIPSNVAKSVFDRLKTDGTVVRGWLVVRLRSVTPELNEMMKYGVDEGAAIVSFHHMTDQPSPAQQAGLRTGDVIVKWADARIQSQPELSRAVAETTIGDPVVVEAVRGGRTLQFNVTVGQRPNHWDTLERYREKQRGKNPLEDFLPGQ